MRVLVLDEGIPLPCDSGKKTRSYQLLSRLGKMHSLEYLCFENPGTRPVDTDNFRKSVSAVHAVPTPWPSKSGLRFYCRLAANLASPLPYVMAPYYRKAYLRTLRGLVESNPFDLIHCEISLYSIYLRNLIRIPSVGVAHNVEAEIWERYYRNERNAAKKLYILLQWRKLRKFEGERLHGLHTCIAVSDRDKKYITRVYGHPNVQVVPNGVDTDYFCPDQTEGRKGNIVFTGSMDWRPNQDAVNYFLETMWPRVKASCPEATFTVVGRDPPPWIVQLGGRVSGVEITGTVEDVRPYLRQAALVVVPLRIGGGSRLKLLEALSVGKTVVSTTIGAEGLEVEDGETVWIADHPRRFADRVVEVLRNPEGSESLRARGRQLVESRYRWEQLAHDLDKIWKGAAQCG